MRKCDINKITMQLFFLAKFNYYTLWYICKTTTSVRKYFARPFQSKRFYEFIFTVYVYKT